LARRSYIPVTLHGVEAAIFASSDPVGRETLARIVGKSCSIDLLIDDIREELCGRPDDLSWA
jgi:segregation and condensation protein B